MGWAGIISTALSMVMAGTLAWGRDDSTGSRQPRHTLTVEVEGKGTVTPEGRRFEHGTTVTLTAEPGPDHLFDCWRGDYSAACNPLDSETEVLMDGDKTVTVTFLHRPGTTGLDLSSDFRRYVGIVGLDDPVLEIDRNELDFIIRDGVVEDVFVGNGIPDVAELHLVEAAVKNRSLDMTHRSGICHDRVWAAWQTNLAQADKDLAGKDPAVIRTVAAYMTLGDYKSVRSVTRPVEARFPGLTIDPGPYDRSMQRYLYWKDDADNDGVPNREEWEAAVSAGSPDVLELFARYAFDGERPPEPEEKENTPTAAKADDTQPHICSGVRTGTFRFLPSASRGGGSGTVSGGTFPDRGVALGIEETVLPLGVTIEVRAVPDTGSAFSHWGAPDSMLDGSRDMTARFMLMGDMTARACFHKSQLEIPGDTPSVAITVVHLNKGAIQTQGPNGERLIAGSPWSSVTVSARSLDPGLKVVGWIVENTRDAGDGQRNYLDTVTIHPLEGCARPILSAQPPDNLKTTELLSSQGGFVTASTVPGQQGRFARRIRFVEGTPVRFDAVAYPGYELNHWEGLSPENRDPGPHVVVTPSEPASVEATLKPKEEYRITVETAVARPAEETSPRERVTPPARRPDRTEARTSASSGKASSIPEEASPRTTELLRVLREDNGEAAAEALKTLTRDPETTLANLPMLLAEAKVANEPMDPKLLLGGQRHAWWLGYARTKGALVLARVADSLREVTDETERVQAVKQFTRVVNEELETEGASKFGVFAVSACYYSVFYPQPTSNVCPPRSAAIDCVLSALWRCMAYDDSSLRMKVSSLLTNAAYVLPKRREELLREIESLMGPETASESRSMMDYLLRVGGEPVTSDVLHSVQGKSEEELVDFLMTQPIGTNRYNSHLSSLVSRLPESPNRLQIVCRLLSNRMIAGRCSASLVPGPIAEDAARADKEFTDGIIAFLGSQITEAEGTSARWNYAVTCLRRLVVSDVDELRSKARSTAEAEPMPYGAERVVQLLVDALGSKSPSIQREAARELGSACWLGEDPARAALDGLIELRGHIEQTHDLSRPDSEFPFKGGWDDRPEKYVHNEAVNAIRQAQQALAVYERQQQAIEK